MSRTALVVLALAFGLPAAAGACPVCIGPEQESRDAFVLTTVLLSVLPLGMIGGVVGWVWRLSRARERGALSPREPGATAGTGPISNAG